MSIPYRYLPDMLSKKDKSFQQKNLLKSRKQYKKGKYFQRPKVKSFKSKKSSHVSRAKKIYDIDSIKPSKELAEKTKCTEEALEKIVNKGRGAYYSSGSRPNQTPDSWGIARLASSLTGGNSSVIDIDILKEGCKSNSKALKMAKVTCKKKSRCKKYTLKNKK